MSKQLSLFDFPEFKCQYCDTNTSDVDYDYLVGTDHLSCYLQNTTMQRRTTLFTIPEELVYDTPNDAELGAKVRQIYNDIKK
jgi:hypothetical protein